MGTTGIQASSTSIYTGRKYDLTINLWSSSGVLYSYLFFFFFLLIKSKRANFDPTHELEEILLEDNPLKVRKRAQPKRSAVSNANTSFKSHGSEVILSETSPERQLMEDKFLTFDYTKPEENERRNAEMDQHRWTQRMTKTNGSEKQRGAIPPTRGSSRKVATGTYNTSVADYINQQPATPLSASDILKLEELERMKRTQQAAHHLNAQQQHQQQQQQQQQFQKQQQNMGRERKRTQDWCPPSGITATNMPFVDPDPLNAIHERNNYILQAGGVPPPMKPPPPVKMSSSAGRMADINMHPESIHNHHLELELDELQLSHHYNHRRRSSSDSSYQMPSSPENLHRPLMTASTSSIVTNTTTNTINQQQQRSRTGSPVPPQKWMFDANTLPPVPLSSTSSLPLPPPGMPPPPIPTGFTSPQNHELLHNIH